MPPRPAAGAALRETGFARGAPAMLAFSALSALGDFD
jgi:hypothetical protein